MFKSTLRFLGNRFLFLFINLLCKTLSIEIKNHWPVHQLFEKKENIVLAFWHGTMLAPWFLHSDRNFAALVSQSKDGELLTRVLTKWKYKVSRGSSHRGGKEALNQLLELGRKNYSVAITPDGPTGPPFVMKPGAVVTAKKVEMPLVLLGIAYKNAITLRSWDQFQIPKPFSKAAAVYSDPIYIDKNLSYDETTEVIRKAEHKLNKLQAEAKRIVNGN